MLSSAQIDGLIASISQMGRNDLIARCLNFRGAFPVDFTPEFLAGMSLDRLRHVYVAICLQNNIMPHDLLISAA